MENNNVIFNNDYFLERVYKAASSYGYSYKDSAYLRFCFLIFYFEIDICRLHEEKFPHKANKEEYDYNIGYKKTEKEFLYDIPRSNNQNISFALKPYVDIFLDALESMECSGLFPDVKDHMRNILIKDKDISEILSDYETFIAFLYEMIPYLDSHYGSEEYYEFGDPSDATLCAYSSYKDYYIDCHINGYANSYTQKLWNDVSLYPSYIKLGSEEINDIISNNIKDWNFIFENWNLLKLLCEDKFLWDMFKAYINDNSRKINKHISALYKGNDYSRTDLLLDNAEKYSYLFSFSFTPPRRKKEKIKELAIECLKTPKDKYCFLFCAHNLPMLKKLNQHNLRLLFRIACLGEYTANEVPHVDLDDLIYKLVCNIDKHK